MFELGHYVDVGHCVRGIGCCHLGKVGHHPTIRNLAGNSRLKLPVGCSILTSGPPGGGTWAAMALRRYVGSRDYTEVAVDTGHIGIYVSRRALEYVPGRIADWLRERARR
jgi:hypothetical protein